MLTKTDKDEIAAQVSAEIRQSIGRDNALGLNKYERAILHEDLKAFHNLMSAVMDSNKLSGLERMAAIELEPCMSSLTESAAIMARKYGIENSRAGNLLALCIDGLNRGIFDLDKLFDE